MEKLKVTFLPIERSFASEKAESILEIAIKAGIHINASCGGTGACGKCRVKVVEGISSSPSHPAISAEEYRDGVRLACMTIPESDVVVEIPLESQVDRSALRRRRQTPHILSVSGTDGALSPWKIDPPVIRKYCELPLPTLDDNISDLGRVIRELKRFPGIDALSADPGVFGKIGKTLRESDWKVTVTISWTGEKWTILQLEQGDKEGGSYAMAIDIGTTTVCAQLFRTEGRGAEPPFDQTSPGDELSIVAELSDYNDQISFGEDVISRIMYSRKKGGLRRLRDAVVKTINGLIGEILLKSGVAPGEITHVVLAGNTTMTHLVLGIDPRYIMLSPYTPAAISFPPANAKVLGFDIAGWAPVFIYPCVSSYVGGDIVSGVMGSGMFQREEVTLFMDVGTNGEIVLGNREWLMCTSCSAGPAFEGGGITFGMKAGRGAIEQVRINPTTYEPMIITIGKAKPVGICGSGLIDLVAELLDAGLIEQNGKFRRDLPTKRLREGGSGWEYVISYAGETQIMRDIVITEPDMDNLIRAKAAMYGGCKVLLEGAGMTFGNLDRVIVAGGFGHYISLEKAQAIGLLPELPFDRFLFIGNGSLLGARLVSLSRGFMNEAERVAAMMTNIELSNNKNFMDEYVAAMFLPHTNESEFTVARNGRRKTT